MNYDQLASQRRSVHSQATSVGAGLRLLLRALPCRPPLPPAVRRLAARVPRPRVLDATHTRVRQPLCGRGALHDALTHRWCSPQLFAVSTPLHSRPRRAVARRGCRRRLDRISAPLRRGRHRRRVRHRALGACAAPAAPCETAKTRCGLINRSPSLRTQSSEASSCRDGAQPRGPQGLWSHT